MILVNCKLVFVAKFIVKLENLDSEIEQFDYKA